MTGREMIAALMHRGVDLDKPIHLHVYVADDTNEDGEQVMTLPMLPPVCMEGCEYYIAAVPVLDVIDGAISIREKP